MVRDAFEIGGETVAPGKRRTVDIPISLLSNHTPMVLPVHVIHGRREGPTMFVSAAVHGDEVLGVEIIRRLVQSKAVAHVRGTLLFIPIVNLYGFISHIRYLPDRRDLNRSFPGRPDGSLAEQLAHTFMTEIVQRSDYGIDLHTGAIHRANLPQIRANLREKETRDLALAFGAPLILNSSLRDGSLRQEACKVGCDTLLYEAGEALRFDELAIRIGVKGVMSVCRHLGILGGKRAGSNLKPSIESRSSYWLRASAGGLLRAHKGLGDFVTEGVSIGVISDPFGHKDSELFPPKSGVIIGRTNLPVINQGDALFHIAKISESDQIEDQFEQVEQEIENDPLFDGSVIV